MGRLKLRSPVTLIAGVALFLSLAGTGIAASRYHAGGQMGYRA